MNRMDPFKDITEEERRVRVMKEIMQERKKEGIVFWIVGAVCLAILVGILVLWNNREIRPDVPWYAHLTPAEKLQFTIDYERANPGH